VFFALKYSQKDKVAQEKAVNHIIQERNLLEEVSHTFICGLKYSFQDEVYLYMILDLMRGGDLRFHIKSRVWNEVSHEHAAQLKSEDTIFFRA
jgi:serine/threonine kinase 32